MNFLSLSFYQIQMFNRVGGGNWISLRPLTRKVLTLFGITARQVQDKLMSSPPTADLINSAKA